MNTCRKTKRYATFGLVALVSLLVPLAACTSAHNTPADSSKPKQSSGFTVPGKVHALAVPTGVSAVQIVAMSSTGAIIGNGNPDDPDKITPIYWSSATAKPVRLKTATETTGVLGISSTGIIVGDGLDGPVFWSNKNAAATTIPPPDESMVVRLGSMSDPGKRGSMSDSGVAIGTANSEALDPQTHKLLSSTSRCVTWRLPSTTPILLALPTGASQNEDCAVTPSGVLTATSTIGDRKVPTTWSGPGSEPVLLGSPREGNPYAVITDSGPKGLYIGSGVRDLPDRNQFVGIYWSSADASPADLVDPSVSNEFTASAVSDTGVIYGYSLVPRKPPVRGPQVKGFAWASATAKPRPIAPPTGLTNVAVMGRSPSGDLFGTAEHGQDWVPLVWTTN